MSTHSTKLFNRALESKPIQKLLAAGVGTFVSIQGQMAKYLTTKSPLEDWIEMRDYMVANGMQFFPSFPYYERIIAGLQAGKPFAQC